MTIAENIQHVRSGLPGEVKLVAVSKTHPNAAVMEAYNAGQRIFGENKVQELVAKYETLPKDIDWHFIGHLQTNKVKYIAHFIHLIHGVDSLKLLKVINKEATKHNRKIACLLQVKIAGEDTKFGMTEQELFQLLNSDEYKQMKNICIVGLMGMASNTKEEDKVMEEFNNLYRIFNMASGQHFKGAEYFKELSMGMSHDYKLGIKQGSTMVRIGSLIFGERNYKN